MTSDRFMLQQAYQVATTSRDTSSQNGAVILGQSFIYIGANNILSGVTVTNDRLERPAKYLYTEHAERQAIFAAVKQGANLHGSVLYCPWAACADCARAIIGCGVRKLVRHKQAMERVANHMWEESIAAADAMMYEADVEVVEYDGEIDRPTLLFNGEPW